MRRRAFLGCVAAAPATLACRGRDEVAAVPATAPLAALRALVLPATVEPALRFVPLRP